MLRTLTVRPVEACTGPDRSPFLPLSRQTRLYYTLLDDFDTALEFMWANYTDRPTPIATR